jgi:hypothetical protein
MSVMTDDSSDTPRRRKPSAEARAGREAAALVRELNRRLGQWQAASVKLHTIAGRLKSNGHADPAVKAEAHALLSVVSREAYRLEDLLSDQPEAVARHGRIEDTRRSFEVIADRLRESLKLLGEDEGAG